MYSSVYYSPRKQALGYIRLQEQLKDQPESPEKIALELAIENAIAGHQNSIKKFDKLQELIGLFQLATED
jgi:hypothetical protein